MKGELRVKSPLFKLGDLRGDLPKIDSTARSGPLGPACLAIWLGDLKTRLKLLRLGDFERESKMIVEITLTDEETARWQESGWKIFGSSLLFAAARTVVINGRVVKAHSASLAEAQMAYEQRGVQA